MTPSNSNWRHWGWSRETSSRQQQLSRARCGWAPAGPTLDREELQGRSREGRKRGIRTKADISVLAPAKDWPPSYPGHTKRSISDLLHLHPLPPACVYENCCSDNTQAHTSSLRPKHSKCTLQACAQWLSNQACLKWHPLPRNCPIPLFLFIISIYRFQISYIIPLVYCPVFWLNGKLRENESFVYSVHWYVIPNT